MSDQIVTEYVRCECGGSYPPVEFSRCPFCGREEISTRPWRDVFKRRVLDLAAHHGLVPAEVSAIVAWHERLRPGERAQFAAVVRELQEEHNAELGVF